MSDAEQTDEVKNKVTISGDDCDNVKKYCGHFGVPSSAELDTALEEFKKDPSYDNQSVLSLKSVSGC